MPGFAWMLDTLKDMRDFSAANQMLDTASDIAWVRGRIAKRLNLRTATRDDHRDRQHFHSLMDELLLITRRHEMVATTDQLLAARYTGAAELARSDATPDDAGDGLEQRSSSFQ